MQQLRGRRKAEAQQEEQGAASLQLRSERGGSAAPHGRRESAVCVREPAGCERQARAGSRRERSWRKRYRCRRRSSRGHAHILAHRALRRQQHRARPWQLLLPRAGIFLLFCPAPRPALRGSHRRPEVRHCRPHHSPRHAASQGPRAALLAKAPHGLHRHAQALPPRTKPPRPQPQRPPLRAAAPPRAHRRLALPPPQALAALSPAARPNAASHAHTRLDHAAARNAPRQHHLEDLAGLLRRPICTCAHHYRPQHRQSHSQAKSTRWLAGTEGASHETISKILWMEY
mmetsp:Transcript_8880/g.12277  ORF Transcript_8880/g.12277 Transcript_8880/m.12277 type:complete len:287 (+) Transcript_8880:192-1052(+)